MKSNIILFFSAFLLLIGSCTNGQTKSGGLIPANQFADQLKQTPGAQLVDVRTPGEFEKGHLENAININWNGNDFQAQTAKLDKSKPIFVYCLSGGRSAAASSQLRSDGFKEVYEMAGGIMKWRAAGLPETTATSGTTAAPAKPTVTLTRAQFDLLLNSGKILLFDFYADWCEPCKRMKPYLDEIALEMQDKVEVIRINADDNKDLCKDLKIDALPVLQIYKNKTLIWSNTGFITKEEVVKQLK